MAKITYLLGAGASYNACPILEKQAEMMIEVARREITRLRIMLESDGVRKNYDFDDKKHLQISERNEYKILWHIGHFGEKAKEFGTIDTYAKKLSLNQEWNEYRLLKMSVSIFFDLWENFYFKQFYTSENNFFNKIDNRYKSLFSVLLDSNGNDIELNNEFKFLTWNYDLQLEETFKLFLSDKHQKDLHIVDNLLKFKSENNNNNVLHLNGYRGFYQAGDEKQILLNTSSDLEDYWRDFEGFFDANKRKQINFNNHIKYAWEHNLDDSFFQKIANILATTEILIIIGYSFPAFNRAIDQFLFSKINNNRIKKIIYQDPNATTNMIENLFEKPERFQNKIEAITDAKELKQFYLPNDFFISQKNTYDVR